MRPPLTLVLLAAGLGSRFGGTKQLAPVGPTGELLLDYTIYDARRAGFDGVVCVVRPELEAPLRAHHRPWVEAGLPLDYAHQTVDAAVRRRPWGTVEAVLAADGLVRGCFAVANADDGYGAGAMARLAERLAGADPAAPAFHLVGYRLRDTLSRHGGVTRAVCRLGADDALESLAEVEGLESARGGITGRKGGAPVRLAGDELVSMNLWGFTPAVFDLLGARFDAFRRAHAGDPDAECPLPEAIAEALAAGRATVRVLESPDAWFGLTHAADLEAVRQEIRLRIERGIYPDPLLPERR